MTLIPLQYIFIITYSRPILNFFQSLQLQSFSIHIIQQAIQSQIYTKFLLIFSYITTFIQFARQTCFTTFIQFYYDLKKKKLISTVWTKLWIISKEFQYFVFVFYVMIRVSNVWFFLFFSRCSWRTGATIDYQFYISFNEPVMGSFSRATQCTCYTFPHRNQV